MRATTLPSWRRSPSSRRRTQLKATRTSLYAVIVSASLQPLCVQRLSCAAGVAGGLEGGRASAAGPGAVLEHVPPALAPVPTQRHRPGCRTQLRRTTSRRSRFTRAILKPTSSFSSFLFLTQAAKPIVYLT